MKQYAKKILGGLLLALISAGCVNVNYVGEHCAPTTDVKVFMRGEDITGNYRVMGHATATLDDGDTVFLSGDAMNEALLEKARTVGADAVFIISTERRKTGVRSGQTASSSYHEHEHDRGTYYERDEYWRHGRRSHGGHHNDTHTSGYSSANANQWTSDIYTHIVEADFLKLKK